MLQQFSLPVANELKAFDVQYQNILKTGDQRFQFLLDFISETNGKRIRPLTVFLVAKLCGTPNQKTLDYALILELLHNATLVHDDVVDNTKERRGQPSAMAQFGNQIAVLLGDYILSKAITLGVATENIPILKILATVAQNLSEGELTQLIGATEPVIDENRYFEIIRKKTAILLASCAEMGAMSVDADAETIQTLRLVGENIGLCFQLRDDIFDYYEQGDIGKPTGNDIREGKITLPLLYALQTASPMQVAEMMKLIRTQDFSAENIRRLLDFAKQHNGVEYAQAKMMHIKQETVRLLQRFPDSETKQALLQLIAYTIERKK